MLDSLLQPFGSFCPLTTIQEAARHHAPWSGLVLHLSSGQPAA